MQISVSLDNSVLEREKGGRSSVRASSFLFDTTVSVKRMLFKYCIVVLTRYDEKALAKEF